MALVPVKFLKSAGGYNEGEIAGFTAERAKALIDSKIAEPFKPAKSKPKAKPAEPKPEA